MTGALVPALAVAVAAAAQTVPQPTTPTGVPGRAQVDQPLPQATAPAPSTARVDAAAALARPPCALEGSTVRVVLDRVRFVPVGRPALPPAILGVLAGIAPDAKGEQPIAAVCRVRDAANAALRRAGYVASAQIPPQEIANGELTLAIVLARITEVRVHGEAGRYAGVLGGRIARLRALDPLDERAAERILLLAGDVPGLDVRLSLRPAGTAPGDVIGDLVVSSRRFAVLGNVQNYGSRQIGRETAYIRAETYGLITDNDIVYAGGSSTAGREQRVVQAGYIAGVGTGGATVGARLTLARSRPDLGPLDLRSRSTIAGLDVAVPLVRALRRNLTLTGGFEAIGQVTKVYGGDTPAPLNRDRIRVAFLRLNGALRGRATDAGDAWLVSGGVEVRRGLDILSATPCRTVTDGYTPSRFDGDPEALVMRGDLDGLVRFGRVLSAATAVRGQWADHALLNLEEFSIGNLTIGRGFDPGATSADRAIGVRGELRADVAAGGTLPVQFFGFTDGVWLWNRDAFATENDRNLLSAGGGVRVTLPGRMLIEATYARPLDRALSFDRERPPARLLLSLTAQLTPPAR